MEPLSAHLFLYRRKCSGQLTGTNGLLGLPRARCRETVAREDVFQVTDRLSFDRTGRPCNCPRPIGRVALIPFQPAEDGIAAIETCDSEPQAPAGGDVRKFRRQSRHGYYGKASQPLILRGA